MKNIERSLRGVLSAGFLAALGACGDFVTEPDLRSFMGCPIIDILVIDQSRTGTLASGDCRVDGYLTDMYQLEVYNDRDVIIDLESGDFDAYLVLYDRETGELLADNDDLNETDSDARMSGFLPRGSYVIAATSYNVGEGGQYVLTVD